MNPPGDVSRLTARLLKRFEGLHDGDRRKPGLQPALCPAGYVTVGYGHVLTRDGRRLAGREDLEWASRHHPLRQIDEAKAEALLAEDIEEIGAGVIARLRRPVAPHQAAAMISLAYNIGAAGFAKSEVLLRFNAGDSKGAADAFLNWRFATVNGVKRPILEGRRKAERAVFLGHEDAGGHPLASSPAMTVEDIRPAAEAPLSQSREIRVASAGGAASVTSVALGEIADALRETQATLFGIPLETVQWLSIALGLAVAGCAIAAVAIRLRARRNGER